MQSLGEALKEAVGNLTLSPCSEDYYCSICGNLVPKKTVFILGVEKQVQPRCKCEVVAWEREIREAEERKKRREIERKFNISILGERFQEYRFEKFKMRSGSERALDISRRYAEKFDGKNGISLLIWGEPGNGKSHLAGAIAHVVKERGFIPVFQSVPELLGRIRSTFRKGSSETEKDVMDAVLQCDLLILDDIGAEKISDWVLEALFRIIDGRYRDKKPILFTTNFSPTELLYRFMPEKPTSEHEITAKRIHDRIIEMSVIVENKASSHRQEVAFERAKRLLES